MRQIRIGLLSLMATGLLSSMATPVFCSEADDLPKGKVVERVSCKADQNQSYALYLPSNYTPDKKWPILYAFDAGARGRLPVERFKDAAEKYGYIVVGSNNSRNGPWEPTAVAIQALLEDADKRFALDKKRFYTMGFSGGARVAVRVGYLLKEFVAGVIGCGAGFPVGISPSGSTPFVFFGTIGVDDFNYLELKQLDEVLDTVGIPNRVAIFEGGHDWPPSAVCIEAIEWMEIQAMRSGKRNRDETLIEGLFKARVEKARAHESATEGYQAYVSYDELAKDFKGLKDVTEFEKKAAQLKETKEVKQSLKEEKQQETEQRRREAQLFGLRARLAGRNRLTVYDDTSAGTLDSRATPDDADGRRLALADLKKALADLKKRSDAKESTADRAIARRVFSQYRAWSYETSMGLIGSKKYDLAVEHLAIEAQVQPENPGVLYTLACAYSLKSDKKRALESLKKAVEKGFANLAELEGNKALDGLREEPAFKQIVEEVKKKT